MKLQSITLKLSLQILSWRQKKKKILEEWKKDEDYRKGMLDKIIREEGNVGKKVDDLAVVPNKGW